MRKKQLIFSLPNWCKHDMVSEFQEKNTMSTTNDKQLSITISPINLTTTHNLFAIKLDVKNYLAWKAQFIPILNYQNLMGLIDGSEPTPPKTVTNSDPPTATANLAYFAWFKRDQMLLSWLLFFLSEEIFPYIIGLPFSFFVWSALKNAFGSVSQNIQLQPHIELQDLKRNDLSVSQFLYKAKALANELASAGRQLSVAEFNTIIYRNIGQKFHGIIIALNMMPEPVPFHELHGQLLAHKILIKSIQDFPIANIV